jgi:hypothetical protein
MFRHITCHPQGIFKMHGATTKIKKFSLPCSLFAGQLSTFSTILEYNEQRDLFQCKLDPTGSYF